MPADVGDVLTSPPAASPALPQPPSISRISLFQPCGPSGCSAHQETLCRESNGPLFCSDGKFQLEVTAPAAGECSGESGGCGNAVIKRGRRGRRKAAAGKTLAEYVKVWVEKKVGSGIPLQDCSLPFLCNAPRMVECRMCRKHINPGEEIVCSVRDCPVILHENCAKHNFGFTSSAAFKCPQHVCFTCKQKANWRCIRCMMAAHTKCSPWPDDVRHLDGEHRRAICWRHPKDWRFEMQNSVPTDDVKEAFRRLPLPYVIEEFGIDSFLRDVMENKAEPTPYIHIKRNVYLVKKKRDHANVGIGCTNCNATSTCSEECECKGQSVSCSKACHCSEFCTNRPFRKEKKIKIVKTQFCGWGVVALEAIKKEEFIIEYIGEVINDAQCEQRLWDMKYRGDQNFYMCEIRKDFTIDATFKGNASRFLNHSCNPNCKLEKWHVDGETRVGVFASRAIIAGEPLTYDYRFVHFGPMVKCYCGASNCQGYLGSKKKINKIVISCWGCKRRRTAVVSLPPAQRVNNIS